MAIRRLAQWERGRHFREGTLESARAVMYSAVDLLHTLVVLLAAQGLTPETADPWRGWVVFKQFIRQAVETPDPGVSVQIGAAADGQSVRVALIRQVVEEDGEWLRPSAGVVLEFVFPPRDIPERPWDREADAVSAFEEWSFDFSTLERFIDRVEQHPAFATLMTSRATASVAYWEEA